ncbi:MAG: phosphatase PAP2 family protein, partial [Gallionellaceae bacterium]|nr:phosphatase PAP2 family protein [Gallionellaceae bacterium]
AVSTGLNYAVGRARPDANRGRNYFEPFSAPISESSFPSDHTMLVWAIATPFAEEYKAPWLYGVATLTNLSRVISNRHWFSDTVASSVLGYGIGRIFWESSRSQNNKFRIGTSGRSVTMSWDW